ncbi:hypothetical protein ACFTWF_39790 [Rhodococcus sp. NPDC056960]|uniref:hypothetical protein n=1 Tax=Rhodococcus sp. NPDC056960 TaxID=3345982 RepID=UPI0036360FA4
MNNSGAMVGIGGDAPPDPRLRRWQAKNWRLLRQCVLVPNPATLDENGDPLTGFVADVRSGDDRDPRADSGAAGNERRLSL